jgi:membrane-associated protease RseP (regulator of RpoE activity)
MTSPSTVPDETRPPPNGDWRLNVGLFFATAAAMFVTTVAYEPGPSLSSTALWHGFQFTASLLSILLCHEFGHYIAARIHKVDASLPYFIPLPLLSPFGTMGAVIRMRGLIPTRKALLDIGASGPLAGMAVAVPLYLWGLSHSRLVPVEGTGETGIVLGQSLLLRLLDHIGQPSVPEGMDIMLSPVAFAAWGGMLVTMLNLIPVAQLDGGHVAYALFGTKQDDYARIVHRSLLAFFVVSVVATLARDVRNGFGLLHMGRAIQTSFFWFLWFEILGVLGSVSSRDEKGPRAGDLTVQTRLVAIIGLGFLAGVLREHPSAFLGAAWVAAFALLLAMERKGGALRRSNLVDHPPTAAAPLDGVRKAIAVFTLLLFVALFMPAPFAM